MQNIAFKKIFAFIIPVFVGLLVWCSPVPEGVHLQAWHLLAIFLFAVLGIILKPLPMGAISVIALTLITLTGTLTVSEALSGFSNDIVWLIVIAFFMAGGFIKTGLGMRIAYSLTYIFGKSTLGMGYGIVASDLLLAPAIPSLTARAGGIIFPLLTSLCKAFESEPHKHPRKMGAFLFSVAFQGAVITSAMFLTSMAGNPMIAEIAKKQGFIISWSSWALAAIVPGLISLLVMPYVIYKLYPPEVKVSPEAKSFARKKLQELGKMQVQEWIMLSVFILLVGLWASGNLLHLNATITALIGLSILLCTRVISWDDIIKEKGAWDILIWFSTLIMIAGYLSKLGLPTWFSQLIVSYLGISNWVIGFAILTLIYFYSHYFFASNVAHIGSMYAPFLVLCIAMGTPPILAIFALGFCSSLFGGITHYGCGPAPILFGAGYVKIGDWWRLGFITSVINIIIWLGIGSLWWKWLGFY